MPDPSSAPSEKDPLAGLPPDLWLANISDDVSLIARPLLCMLFGGHSYGRHGNCLVCSYCGHKVVGK